jgi:hypothetical protein
VVLKQTKSTDPSWSEGVEHGLEKREKELGKIRKKGKTLAGRGERERDEALQKKSQTSHKARGTSGSI